jgi:hypothetical protein
MSRTGKAVRATAAIVYDNDHRMFAVAATQLARAKITAKIYVMPQVISFLNDLMSTDQQ